MLARFGDKRVLLVHPSMVQPGAKKLRFRSLGMGGMGATDLAGIVSSYSNSFLWGMPSKVEQGSAESPDVVAETLRSAVANACADQVPGSPCDPSSVTAQINAAVAAYASALQQKQSTFAAQVAAGQVVVPGGSTYVAPTAGPAPVAPPPASSSGGALVGASSSGGVVPTIQLSNASRPGSPLQEGDTFRLVITGPANQPVSVTGSQNGKSTGTSPFGSTDSNGQAVISTQLPPGTAGNWSEMWTVGSTPLPVLNFTVAPAAAAASSSSSSSSSSGSTSSGSTPGPIATNSLTDFLSSDFTAFGYTVPVWAAAVVGGGLAYALMGRGGGRGR